MNWYKKIVVGSFPPQANRQFIRRLIRDTHTGRFGNVQDFDLLGKNYKLEDIPVMQISVISKIDKKLVKEYAASIQEKGVVNVPPIVVEKLPGGERYWVFDGGHRVEALKMLNIPTIKAYVRQDELV